MEVGSRLILQGLESAPHLNGNSCIVTGFKNDRVLVVLENQKVKPRSLVKMFNPFNCKSENPLSQCIAVKEKNLIPDSHSRELQGAEETEVCTA